MYEEVVANTSYELIQFNIIDRVAYISFNRPPLNILNIAMMQEIGDVLSNLMKMSQICAIVFTSTPHAKAFSAGVSVEDHAATTVYQMLTSFHNIFRILHSYAKPTIAVVDGPALGGGCELVAFCDVVIASEKAKFGQPEIRLGVFPPVASVILPRLIGLRRASEMIFTGEPIDAIEAQSLGLVNFVVDEEQLNTRLEEILLQFREGSAVTIEAARRAIYSTFYSDLEEALQKVENQYLLELMAMQDPHEGLKAFMEKRKPDWKHR